VRITSTSSYAVMRDSLGASLSRVSDLQSQLGTMRRINKPSDDPVGSSTALRYRAYEADQASYSQSADDALTRLSGSDTALQDMSSALRRVRELSISAANTSLSPEARESIAAEVDALRGELTTLANSAHGGQALFGGHAGTAVTRAEDGTWSYSGDDGQVQRRVAQGTVLAVNIDGRAAFGFDQPAGEDLLSVVDRLAAATRSGDLAALSTGQAALAGRTTGVLRALASTGAKVNAVEAARARGEQFVERDTAERSAIEDIDLAEAIQQLTAAQTGYQAALGAVAKANMPSLADFLR
jgi:flagellar hook-associated protein 3 FlgL